MDLEGTLRLLTGGLRVKPRVQHPKVHEALRSRQLGWWWFIRYWEDEFSADSGARTVRKRHWIAPSRGDNKIPRKEAECKRDEFLLKLNAPTVEQAVQQAVSTGAALFGEVAKMYEEGYLGRENQIAKPTRDDD